MKRCLHHYYETLALPLEERRAIARRSRIAITFYRAVYNTPKSNRRTIQPANIQGSEFQIDY
jgi:hypothetical protein